MRSTARSAPSCPRASTARCARPGPGSRRPRSRSPAFEIAVFDNLFPAFQAPRGAAEVVVYTDDHDASFGSLPAERAGI